MRSQVSRARDEEPRGATTALGVSRWLIYFAERLRAGADLGTVLDETIAYCLKARERAGRRVA